jgi:hypothetical protein
MALIEDAVHVARRIAKQRDGRLDRQRALAEKPLLLPGSQLAASVWELRRGVAHKTGPAQSNCR